MFRKDWSKALSALAILFFLYIRFEDAPGAIVGLLPLAVWQPFMKPVVVSCGLGVIALWLWGECFFKRITRLSEWLYTLLIVAAPFLMTLICETACNADLTKMNPVVVFGDFGIALWSWRYCILFSRKSRACLDVLLYWQC